MTAGSDRVLDRLTALHPKVIDLSLDLIERLLTAREGVYERMVALVDAKMRTILTVRESETESPRLFSVQTATGEHTPLGALSNPFPELDGVERAASAPGRSGGVRGLTGKGELDGHEPGAVAIAP